MAKAMKRTVGPSSYPSGGFDVTVGEIETISARGNADDEGVISVEASNKQPTTINGFLGLEPTATSGNVVTIKCYDVLDASTSVSEVSAGGDLSSVYFTVEVEGQ